ncbi:hypothetical protein GCM10007858_64890 [Bradyrhizobium liaoningense]|nr:hypothetical protein GCM10007858_64890 [Bradyrhizobium liaoningense]
MGRFKAHAAQEVPILPWRGEDRFACSEAKCEPRWDDRLSTQAVPEWKDHPTPLALRAIDPPPPRGG